MGLLLPVLLAAGLGKILRVVVCLNHHFMLAPGGHQEADVDGEWGVTALVPSDELPVDVDHRLTVHSAEVEKQALAGAERFHLEATPVPTALEEAVWHPRGWPMSQG